MWSLLPALALADTPAPPTETTPPAREVHWSEVMPKRRVQPTYPDAARDLHLAEVACTVHFTIDTAGRPSAVQVTGCPEVFQQATEEAAWKWAFYPLKIDGVAVPATFVLKVKFLDAGPAESDEPLSLLIWAGLGYGQAPGGGAGALSAGVAGLHPDDLWTGELRFTYLYNLWTLLPGDAVARLEADVGPGVWLGPLRLRATAGLAVDRHSPTLQVHGTDFALRVPVGADLTLQPTDTAALQLSARPAWVPLGGEERRSDALIDEIALEGGLWLVPVPVPHPRLSVHLGGGVLLWPDERIAYGTVGVGSLSPRVDDAP